MGLELELGLLLGLELTLSLGFGLALKLGLTLGMVRVLFEYSINVSIWVEFGIRVRGSS